MKKRPYRWSNFLLMRLLAGLFPIRIRNRPQQEQQKVAVYMPDSKKIGDSLYLRMFFAGLRASQPQMKVILFCQKRYCSLLDGFDGVEIQAVLPEQIKAKGLKQKIKRLLGTFKLFRPYQGQFEAVISFKSSFHLIDYLILHTLQASKNIAYVRFPLTSVLQCNLYQPGGHFQDRVMQALSFLVPDKPHSYTMPLPEYSHLQANYQTWVDQDDSKTHIACNFFSSATDQLREGVVEAMISFLRNWLEAYPQDTFCLIPIPQHEQHLKEVAAAFCDDQVIYYDVPVSLENSLALMSVADLCFSPDTSVVHMANGLRKPVLGVYPNDAFNFSNWKPLHPASQVVFTDSTHREALFNFSFSALMQARKKLEQAL